jgi:hypothetical protein
MEIIFVIFQFKILSISIVISLLTEGYVKHTA